MAHGDRPWVNVPDDQRCEALAKAANPPEKWQTFMNYERRCSKKATQSRDGRAVCHVHADVIEPRYMPPEGDVEVAA